jgi:inorganic pyrophosphatase
MSTIDIMIETPKGSREKYHYDADNRVFHFKKALPPGMHFPYDFGLIPGTEGEDGDPLDALVISEFRFFPGCMVCCRLIGGMLANQEEDRKKVRNDRFFFIPEISVQYAHVNAIEDLPKEEIRQLEQFFVNYNKIEGKIFTPLKTVDAKKAFELIQKQDDGGFSR